MEGIRQRDGWAVVGPSGTLRLGVDGPSGMLPLGCVWSRWPPLFVVQRVPPQRPSIAIDRSLDPLASRMHRTARFIGTHHRLLHGRPSPSVAVLTNDRPKCACPGFHRHSGSSGRTEHPGYGGYLEYSGRYPVRYRGYAAKVGASKDGDVVGEEDGVDGFWTLAQPVQQMTEVHSNSLAHHIPEASQTAD
eukprot:gene10638-12317_t